MKGTLSRRILLTLGGTLLALGGAGCASGPRGAGDRPAAPDGQPRVWLTLVAPPGLRGPSKELARQLQEALARHARVWPVETRPDASRARGPVATAGAIRTALRQAHEKYVRMHMEDARRELTRALTLCQRSLARDVTPEEVARIHLYLAAVSHAQHQLAKVGEHAEAAVAYAPALQPDPDVFSPPIRQAIERARAGRVSVTATINSEPPGAAVFWDGLPRGKTPVVLPDQAKGEHYLLLEHPLHQTWEEVIRLSTTATLQVRLSPAAPARIATAVEESPELRPAGAALLGVDSIVLLREEAGGLRLEVSTRSGASRSTLLPAASTPQAIETTARSLAALEPPHRRTGPASQPAPPSRPTARSHWRRYWWAYSLAAAGAIAAGVAIPLAVSGDEPGRPVRLELP